MARGGKWSKFLEGGGIRNGSPRSSVATEQTWGQIEFHVKFLKIEKTKDSKEKQTKLTYTLKKKKTTKQGL